MKTCCHTGILLFGFLFQRYLCKVGVLNKVNDLWAPTNTHLKRPPAVPGPVIYAVTFVEVEIRGPDVLMPLTMLRCFYQNVWNPVGIVLLQPRSTSLGFTPPPPLASHFSHLYPDNQTPQPTARVEPKSLLCYNNSSVADGLHFICISKIYYSFKVLSLVFERLLFVWPPLPVPR